MKKLILAAFITLALAATASAASTPAAQVALADRLAVSAANCQADIAAASPAPASPQTCKCSSKVVAGRPMYQRILSLGIAGPKLVDFVDYTVSASEMKQIDGFIKRNQDLDETMGAMIALFRPDVESVESSCCYDQEYGAYITSYNLNTGKMMFAVAGSGKK